LLVAQFYKLDKSHKIELDPICTSPSFVCLGSSHYDHCTEQNLESINYVFANCSEDDKIYPLTVKEIAQEKQKD
jgi:hypothetical protein